MNGVSLNQYWKHTTQLNLREMEVEGMLIVRLKCENADNRTELFILYMTELIVECMIMFIYC